MEEVNFIWPCGFDLINEIIVNFRDNDPVFHAEPDGPSAFAYW
jgi:hypothetical protein